MSAPARPESCWSCHGPLPSGSLFCPVCGAVQGPDQSDYFHRLGLEPGYDLVTDALERSYFDLQRKLHPDRFATRSPREKAMSQAQATALNDAYQTLKDPLRRAMYLLALRQGKADGIPVLPPAPPDVLMEQMERREELAAARSAGAVREVLQAAQADMLACRKELSAAFAAGDCGQAALLSLRLKYLSKLAEDCRLRRLPVTA